METITEPKAIKRALRELTFQGELPASTECYKCKTSSRPIIFIDDAKGEVANHSPERHNGYPIHPHDSAVFVLYMCEECGEITTIWNQA